MHLKGHQSQKKKKKDFVFSSIYLGLFSEELTKQYTALKDVNLWGIKAIIIKQKLN